MRNSVEPTGRDSRQFNLRLPDGVREEIAAAALANRRSMNAEIVHRVTGKLPPEEKSARSGPPSQDADKFILRLPDGLRDEIAEKARAGGRSMNAECVMRLQGAADSLRDEIAMRAMQGDWAAQNGENGVFDNDTANQVLQNRARMYYRMADAMLIARTATA